MTEKRRKSIFHTFPAGEGRVRGLPKGKFPSLAKRGGDFGESGGFLEIFYAEKGCPGSTRWAVVDFDPTPCGR
jgi:hypothetical protein